MDSQSRIVVKDGRLFISCRPRSAEPAAAAAELAKPVQPPRSKAGDRAALWQGVGIALDYFNSDDSLAVSALTKKARTWADRYFKGYPYAAKPPTAILRTFPNLFNLKVEGKRHHLAPTQGFRLTQVTGPLRLTPAVMSPPSSPEPEGADPQELRRVERRSVNTESFPEFTEPTLAPEEEIDEFIHLKNRTTANKPKMRVDAAMLRGSGLMGTLPEFLGQLARANIETETTLASNPDAVRFELDEDQAASQQHVEMNLFSGLMEAQRRKHKPGILLPRGLAVESPASTEDDSSENEGCDRRLQSSSGETTEEESGEDGDSDSDGGTERHNGETTEDEDDGSNDGTDVSTSTAASSRPNLRKRKVSTLNDDDEASGNDTDASTSTAASVQASLKKRKLSTLDDPETAPAPNKLRLQYHHPAPKIHYYDVERRKLLSRPNPAASPNDPFEALRKTPATKSALETDRPTTSSSSSSSSSAASSHASGSPVPITKIRVPSRSPDGSRSASPDRIIHLRHPVVPSQTAREGSVSSSRSSSSSAGGGGRRIKIVVQKEGRKRKLIEEVE